MALLGERRTDYREIITGRMIPSGIDTRMISIATASTPAESPVREEKPAFIGPRVTKEQLMPRYAPLPGSVDRVTGKTFIDPETGRTATDKNGVLVFQTTRWKNNVPSPEFIPQEKVVGEPIGRESNGNIIFKFQKTRNY